ncbi:endo-1,4-beta-xylanase [Niabella sp. 22666]|uniref:endo-1,4-beta-xylanase n=1 Tax=Niabella sp. 22666 TaxID=3453954 RepID=UPI003F841EDF
MNKCVSRQLTGLGRRLINLYIVTILLLLTNQLMAQNYPPSCVITMPYNNAYFQSGTDVLIKVYATDFGKTAHNGTVHSVEFYNGEQLLGKADQHKDYTYTFIWSKVSAGNYTIKAKATNSAGVSFTSAGVVIAVGANKVIPAGLSAGKGKYLANIYQNRDEPGYEKYWNGVTAENACKWGTIEPVRGEYNWEVADKAYHYAVSRNLVFRYHAGVWASQYPQWLLTLSKDEARAEIVKYLKAIAERFPLADQIDLLNEQLFKHQKDNQKFRELLGGPGTTETDFGWQIWLFEEGRKIFKNTKLVLNDYGLEGDFKAIKAQLELFKALRDRGLVDGFGTQAHAFNVDKPVGDTIKASLDMMATAGLPIYVTELDMNGGIRGRQANDSLQLISFKKVVPVFWEHPAVAGITLWGYIAGTTWMSGTGILSKDGTPNPSLVWLQQYMKAMPVSGYPLGEIVNGKPR